MVWISKYRMGILVSPVAAALRELIEAKASEMGWRIVAQKIMPDHIHLFIQADAKISPSSIVRLLKGFTSRRLGERFPNLRKRGAYLGERAAGYQLLATCPQETVGRHMESQRGHTK
ncbi:MAG: IS200/IS605 family transposase [Candidatus Njordarchaeia archaeon]